MTTSSGDQHDYEWLVFTIKAVCLVLLLAPFLFGAIALLMSLA